MKGVVDDGAVVGGAPELEKAGFVVGKFEDFLNADALGLLFDVKDKFFRMPADGLEGFHSGRLEFLSRHVEDAGEGENFVGVGNGFIVFPLADGGLAGLDALLGQLIFQFALGDSLGATIFGDDLSDEQAGLYGFFIQFSETPFL